MASAGGIAAGLLGSAASEAAAFAAGLAIGPTLSPEVEFLRNEAWNLARTKALDPATAAEVAAENFSSYDDMAQQAAYSGMAEGLFKYLYDVTVTAPGTGELLNMLRRGTINSGNFTHGLRKAKLEPMWDDALANLRNVYLSPDILAVMLQRNVIPNQGQLPGIDLSTSGQVPRFPHVPIDAYAMAKTFGWSQDQLDAQTRIQGLPPGMDLVARMVFRQIVDRGDFNLAAEQSNRRVEWADFEFDGYRQILTAEQYAELQLRGYLTADQRRAGTEKHGMKDTDSDLLYNVLGRGLNLHAAFVAERRGGVFKGPTDAIPDWAMFMLQRGNLRPEVYNLAWAGRHTYPSAFVIRALLTGGAISAADGEQLFLEIGWPSGLAKQVADFYGKQTTTKADPHVAKAQTQLWGTVHRSYLSGEIDATAAADALPHAGVAPGSVDDVLAVWNVEKALPRKTLSAANIRKAYGDSAPNDATGQPWTRDEAVAALIALGYSTENANSYLDM